MKNHPYSVLRNFNIMFMVGLFFITSCKKEDPPELSSENLLSHYSSFEVEVPATPISIENILNAAYTHAESRFGQWWKIDFFINSDKSIDVLWLDNQNIMHLSKIHIGLSPTSEEIPIPSEINTNGRCLGIEKLDDNTFILGYTKYNSYGDRDSEAWYTAFNESGSVLYSTRLFGENNLAELESDGKPGEAGSSVIKYNKSNNSLCVYMSHTHRWGSDSIRHQAGWVGFLDPASGEILTDEEDKQIGSTWFVSHNFDQKCIPVDNGDFYGLFHGDAYPRTLGISRWNSTDGILSRFDFYYILYGSIGDGETKALLGDIIELPNGNVAIVYSTEDLRSKRDLKLVILGGVAESTVDNTPFIIKQTWITNYSDVFVGWGSRICIFDDHILVAWNTFIDKYTPFKTNFALLNMQGEKLCEFESLDEVSLYPTQSFKTSIDGKSIFWISGGNGNHLKVHCITSE